MTEAKPEKKKPTRRKKANSKRIAFGDASKKLENAGATAPASSSAQSRKVLRENNTAPRPSASVEKAVLQSDLSAVTEGTVAPRPDSSFPEDAAREKDSPAVPSSDARPAPNKPASGSAASEDEDVSASDGSSAPSETVSNPAAAESSKLETEKDSSATPTPVLKRPQASKKTEKRSTMVLLVVAIAVVACMAAFVSIRWIIHDDAQLIQGEWCIEASQETLVFNDHEMKLTKSVTYEYSLNTFDKVITYAFTNLQGEGNYYFSLDGKTLVITEGDAPNILVQLGLFPNPAIAVDSTDDNVIVLTKLSDNVDAKPAAKVENNSTKEADTIGADTVADKGESASGE